MPKHTPESFSLQLRIALRDKKFSGLLAPIPLNKRPFYQKVVKDFERMGYCHSPSGMTASIVALWLKHNDESFTLTYDADFHCFRITRVGAN